MTPLTELPEGCQAILRQKGFAQIATLGPDGSPQCTPAWFIWEGPHVRFSLTTTRQKYRNLNADPRVSMSIVDMANPYSYIEIRGTATLEPDTKNTFIDKLAQWYLGQATYPWHQPGDERVTVTVDPTHTTWLLG